MIWEEPPTEAKPVTNRSQTNTQQFLKVLASNPGAWGKYPTECTKANFYRLAKLYPSFEWRHQPTDGDKVAVWARAAG